MHLYGFVDLNSRCIIFTPLITTLKTYTSLNKWHPYMLSQIQCTTNGPYTPVTFSVSTTGGRGGRGRLKMEVLTLLCAVAKSTSKD